MKLLACSFFFSFLGSIPPGTINLSVIQLSLENRLSAALRFSLAAALVEYPFAYIALRFENLLASSPAITANFQLLAAIVMLTLGGSGLYFHKKPSKNPTPEFLNGGFRRGVIISLLNPLAIPFWIGVTAWLRSMGWAIVQTEAERHWYVAGVSLGTFALLALLAFLAHRIGKKFAHLPWLNLLPYFAFLGLGAYSLLKLLLN